jgi:hypothetical protein
MIEIFVLMYLTRKNAALAIQKGRSGALFRVLTIFLWVSNEILFTVVSIRGGLRSNYGIIVVALLGGAIGGLISFVIAKLIPAKESVDSAASSSENSTVFWSEPTSVECKGCGATVKLPATFCDSCGAKIENNLG